MTRWYAIGSRPQGRGPSRPGLPLQGGSAGQWLSSAVFPGGRSERIVGFWGDRVAQEKKTVGRGFEPGQIRDRRLDSRPLRSQKDHPAMRPDGLYPLDIRLGAEEAVSRMPRISITTIKPPQEPERPPRDAPGWPLSRGSRFQILGGLNVGARMPWWAIDRPAICKRRPELPSRPACGRRLVEIGGARKCWSASHRLIMQESAIPSGNSTPGRCPIFFSAV